MASSALKTFKVMKPQWNFVRIQNLSQVVKPHVPQISFRKGGIIPKHAPEAAPIIAVQGRKIVSYGNFVRIQNTFVRFLMIRRP